MDGEYSKKMQLAALIDAEREQVAIPIQTPEPEIKFKVGDVFNSFGVPWRIMSISREGICIKPVGARLIIPGSIRDKNRKRHK